MNKRTKNRLFIHETPHDPHFRPTPALTFFHPNFQFKNKIAPAHVLHFIFNFTFDTLDPHATQHNPTHYSMHVYVDGAVMVAHLGRRPGIGRSAVRGRS